jgi:hypothetical protein
MKQKPSYSSVIFEKYKCFVKQINHTSVSLLTIPLDLMFF